MSLISAAGFGSSPREPELAAAMHWAETRKFPEGAALDVLIGHVLIIKDAAIGDPRGARVNAPRSRIICSTVAYQQLSNTGDY